MSKVKRYHLLIKGIVQGVGFRPFVYNLARSLNLKGWVLNSSEGVHIEIEGSDSLLEIFISKLVSEKPPRAEIDSIEKEMLPPVNFSGFTIRESEQKEGAFILISPDIATCEDCRSELFNSEDRRHRYPFINCTNCGPRFTIIEDIPYDRPKTTMKKFQMCPLCLQEYDDPGNRRFHAQPNACHTCGPQLMLVIPNSALELWKLDFNFKPINNLSPEILSDYRIESTPHKSFLLKEEALKAAEALIRKGGIIAIKGLGGFHIACDASNEEAVKTLRQRKRRPSKPFAVMFKNLEHAREYVFLTNFEKDLLESPSAPIVLAKKIFPDRLAESVSPKLREHGVMLSSTPLHHLLLNDISLPLIMTSGNLSEEPIVKDNQEAFERLSDIVDAFLIHNRDIYSRYDDSVIKQVNIYRMTLRRARSYAPYPIRFPFGSSPQLLACGPELKCTFCLTREQYAFVSQHLGDLEDELTYRNYSETIELYKKLFKIDPEVYICDLHPDYLSTHYAFENHREKELLRVQHHHAHIASVLGEHGEKGPVIGFSFDGTGYGTDGTVWGGEVLISTTSDFERYAHLLQVPLPGGESAIKKPYRMAISVLKTIAGNNLPQIPLLDRIPLNELEIIKRMIETGSNSPLTSSMGRLFDAAAAISGIGEEATYEAELAIEFEAAADDNEKDSYHFELIDESPVKIDFRPVFSEMIKDVLDGKRASSISMKFHRAISEVILQIAQKIRKEVGIDTVAISGGVWQNSILTRLACDLLEKNEFKLLLHKELPPNDGCISYGQAVIAGTKFS